MIRRTLLFALVALPLAAPARGADGASPALAEAARAAGGIESSLDALDRSSEARRSGESERCSAGFTMDGLMKHFDQEGLNADMGLDMALVENHSLCYYQCLAYAGQDLARCEPLKALKINVGMRGGHLPGNLACIDHNYDLHFIRALITRSPDFKQACRETLLKGLVSSDDITTENVDAKCAMILANAGDPAALCAAAGPKPFHVGEKPQNAGKCELFYRGVGGDAAACEKLPDESHIKERCFGYAAFYKAFHAGDPKLCANNPICRIFFGAGVEACEPYAHHVRGAVCREAPEYGDPAAREKARGEAEREALERAGIGTGPARKLKAQLDGLEAANADPAPTADLRRRYEAILSRIAAPQ